jgi:septum site-determining protein MinD
MAKLVTVHSFRGGTGKSNTTTNVAALTAAMGKRVGIVDTDIQSPGIHVLFGLNDAKVNRALNDYLYGRCAIEEAVYDVTPPLAAAGGGAIYLVPSSMNPREIARVLREGYNVNRLGEGFRDLVKSLKLDYLFIDTHPGLNEETLLAMALSDVILMVLRPDQQDLQGTAVAVDVARQLNVQKLMLVVNKALPGMDPEKLKTQLETLFRTPVAEVLPLTEDLMRLGSAGVFAFGFPDHAISAAYKRLALAVA